VTGDDLHRAVLSFDAAAVKELLALNQVAVDVPDSLGLSPLMSASQRGEVSIADILVRHGAQVDFANSSGKTSLMLAR
jgi:ankyrin repeat protein